jgi:hypothetical protein
LRSDLVYRLFLFLRSVGNYCTTHKYRLPSRHLCPNNVPIRMHLGYHEKYPIVGVFFFRFTA